MGLWPPQMMGGGFDTASLRYKVTTRQAVANTYSESKATWTVLVPVSATAVLSPPLVGLSNMVWYVSQSGLPPTTVISVASPP